MLSPVADRTAGLPPAKDTDGSLSGAARICSNTLSRLGSHALRVPSVTINTSDQEDSPNKVSPGNLPGRTGLGSPLFGSGASSPRCPSPAAHAMRSGSFQRSISLLGRDVHVKALPAGSFSSSLSPFAPEAHTQHSPGSPTAALRTSSRTVAGLDAPFQSKGSFSAAVPQQDTPDPAAAVGAVRHEHAQSHLSVPPLRLDSNQPGETHHHPSGAHPESAV